MIYIQEFEFIEEDGMFSAIPFGLEGGTCGDDIEDAVAMAADWLRGNIEHQLVSGMSPKSGKLGNEPRNGGRVIAVSVDCDLSRVDAVTAADAARMLGVSSARVAQMCESGKLTSWREGSRRMVLKQSVEARIAENPKPGRPKLSEALEG